ncbi:MAG: GldG family protein, partial [Chitinivibrionia bacterium]|nr:GldG family protein [Chitinivibrionia bacterium]
MKKHQLAQICGIAGALLAVSGAVLYAINFSNRPLVLGALGAGLVLAALFAALNAGLIRSFFGKRSSRYGANMLAMIILFVCILTVIQTLSVRHSVRFDLTRNARFSLAPQTTSLLGSLATDVTIIAFYKKSAPERAAAENLLDQYAHASPRVRYEFIDPDRRPQYARDLGVTNYGTTVVQAGDKRELVTDLDEEKLTNAVLKATRDVTKAVYFVQGHGEKDPQDKEAGGYSFVKEAIEKEGYRVGTLSLFDEEAVPADAHIIIVAGPE